MNNTTELIRGLFLIVPIAVLLSVGGLIALNSGVSQPGQGFALRRYAGNFGFLLFHLACVAAILMLVQRWVGLGLGW